MLRLEDITTYPFVYFSYLKLVLSEYEIAGLKLISDEELTDYQKLQDYLESCSPNTLGYDFLKKQLDSVIERAEENNSKGKNPEIYRVKGYYRNEHLAKTDKVIDGSRLITYNPLVGINKTTMLLRSRSIEEIKQLISHTTPEGKNALEFMLTGVGKVKLQEIQFALNFYEEQVKRQYEYYQYKSENMFDKGLLAKIMVLTNSQTTLHEIIRYIIENKPELVWGKLSDLQIEKLQKFLAFSKSDLETANSLIDSRLNGTQSPLFANLKETDYFNEYVNFICMLADYITLKEAQEGLVRTRTIERFIVK